MAQNRPTLKRFFENSDLTAVQARKKIEAGLKGSDYGEFFQEITNSETILKDGGLYKSVSLGNFSSGFGVRFGQEDKVGYGYTNELTKASLDEAIRSARHIAKSGQSGSLKVTNSSGHGFGAVKGKLYDTRNPLDGMDAQSKIAAIDKIEAAAHSLDTNVKNVTIQYQSSYQDVHIITQDGKSLIDRRPSTTLMIGLLVANDEGELQQGKAMLGGPRTCHEVFDRHNWEPVLKSAFNEARELHRAVEAPGGKMDLVLGPGWPAIILHEAVGHGMEGDFNRKDVSVYSGKIGKRVATPGVTIVEEGNIPGQRGSLHFDDEGTPTQKNVLVENGILKKYMQDRQNAHLVGVPTTGNGRRESFAHTPMPRMTNTYFAAGEYDPQEIIESVEDGLYVASISNGQVDITTGQFNMNATLCYRIRNGKLEEPIKGASIVGEGHEVLQSIEMVGNDLLIEKNAGMCGKEGQSVPVGCGQPSIKASNMTVGGTDLSKGPS